MGYQSSQSLISENILFLKEKLAYSPDITKNDSSFMVSLAILGGFYDAATVVLAFGVAGTDFLNYAKGEPTKFKFLAEEAIGVAQIISILNITFPVDWRAFTGGDMHADGCEDTDTLELRRERGVSDVIDMLQ